MSRTRLCPCAVRHGSTSDRPRHQRPLRTDALGTRRGGVRVGFRPAARHALHHQCQQGRNPLRHRVLPEGRRRLALAAATEAMFAEDFEGRVLPFDEAAAVHYAEIVAARRREGRPIEAFDAQIAATARVVGAGLATRDTGDFAGCGLTLINPWEVP